ncbi:unnamed protein product [Boreogadus saida]
MSAFLKEFKTSRYFPTKVRAIISDFAVFITILTMVLVDYGLGIPSPKLQVPSKFKPTRDDRGWSSPGGAKPLVDHHHHGRPRAALHHPHLHGPADHRRHHQPQGEQAQESFRGYHLDLLWVAWSPSARAGEQAAKFRGIRGSASPDSMILCYGLLRVHDLRAQVNPHAVLYGVFSVHGRLPLSVQAFAVLRCPLSTRPTHLSSAYVARVGVLVFHPEELLDFIFTKRVCSSWLDDPHARSGRSKKKEELEYAEKITTRTQPGGVRS